MCTHIQLDERQKATLKACIEESKQPNRSIAARLRTSLTMVVLGMHSTSSRVPTHYDKNNKLF